MPVRLVHAAPPPHDPVAPVRVREWIRRIDVERLLVVLLRAAGRRAVARLQEVRPAEMPQEIRFPGAAGADDAARHDRSERIDDRGEASPAGNPDVAEPRHRQVFLRRANGEALLLETADHARETAVLVRSLRGLVEARPRCRIVPALLLLRRDTLQLGQASTALARLPPH